MGHHNLGILPRTHKWKEVIQKLASAADVSEIAESTFAAAKTGLERIPKDTGFTETLTTIFKFVESANAEDFESALEKNGFKVPSEPSLFDITSTLKDRIDSDLSRKRIKSDVGEIAQNSFSEVLTKHVSSETSSIFGATANDLRDSLKNQLSGNRFKDLMHDFFSTFTRRYLLYYLSREIPNHVGPKSSFKTIDQHGDFSKAFDLYVRQTVRITDEFTPGWFGKSKFEQSLNRENVTRYAHVAFKKIVSEFTRGGKVPDG